MSSERTNDIYDVVISGFGPTGATLANLLAAKGLSVAVLDRDLSIYDKPRAITADHEAMRAFQAAGLAEEIEEGTSPHPGTDFLGVEGQLIKQFYPMPARPLGWEPSFMFFQPALEATLRSGMDRYSNSVVMLGHELETFRQNEQGVEVDVVSLAGAMQTVRGRYLVGCDGARSRVRNMLQVTVHDLAFDEWWVVVDVQLLADIDLPDRCVQYCRPSRPGTYIVGPERLRRWEIKVMPGEDPRAFEDHEYTAKVLAAFVDPQAIMIQRVAVYRFHAVVAERWSHGRVLLAGDAAHQMPPFMGQGMCAGIRDAVNLAWKLDYVIRGEANQRLLDTYAQERRPHVQQVVEHAKSFGLIIGELDEAAAQQRDFSLRSQLLDGSAPTVRQAFIPGLGAGLIAQDTQGIPVRGAGKLFPQPWVHDISNSVRSRLDDLACGRFYVVTLDEDEAEHAQRSLAGTKVLGDAKVFCLAPGTREIANVRYIQEETPLCAEWLAQNGVITVIVRPDGFAYGGAENFSDISAMMAAIQNQAS